MVDLEAKREAAKVLQDKHSVSERRACKVLDFPRSTKRHNKKPNPLNEKIAKRLQILAERKKRFGSPRLHRMLLREGFEINHKRTERIYGLEGLALKKKSKRKRYRSETRAPLAEAERVNQHWSMDFVSDQLVDGRRFRGLTIKDIFSRECPKISLGRSMPAVRVTQALNELKYERGLPEVIVLDNGPEMISFELDQWAYENDVKLHFIEPGKPTQNAFIESFNRTFRDECLNMHWFWNLDDARKKIETWRKEYNEENPHSSIGYLTPKEFAEKAKQMLTG